MNMMISDFILSLRSASRRDAGTLRQATAFSKSHSISRSPSLIRSSVCFMANPYVAVLRVLRNFVVKIIRSLRFRVSARSSVNRIGMHHSLFRSLRLRASARCNVNKISIRHSALRTPHSAFTLIELMVALGLMALLMSMIATVFSQASISFRRAKAAVEIHQNARAAHDIMLRDFAAGKFCEYEDKSGYFALSWHPDRDPADADVQYTQAVTFTTLAEQTGAEALVPGVSPQVALVRYSLEWDGGLAEDENENKYPTYRLMKSVRFPQLPYSFCDMNEFEDGFVPDEAVTTDVLALGVLEMKVRILYKGRILDVWDHGRCTAGDTTGLEDDDSAKQWTQGPVLNGEIIRVLGGDGSPRVASINAAATDTRIPADFSTTPPPYTPGTGDTYRVEDFTIDNFTSPTWIELQDRGSGVGSFDEARMCPMRVIEDVTGSMDTRMPYLVEITFHMTDQRSTRFYWFSRRFHIPASEFD